MVDGVTRGSVDDSTVGNVLAIVNDRCPDVDKQEEDHVEPFVEWEDEDEDRVRRSLEESVERVKRESRKRCGDDPLVMLLVEILV